ncbi:predicted protein [Uncinocarpus reesii 1704]|uniref:PNPLA domain-containing protein n=1 Tax=Uncinocarpus reesii (strain UAMH 1704) TaxID=336963 RepID=C4K099_UNCRE|nr:uncharacterized protein UREG_07913 [Uncinocarpus reesii 1704]EEP83048.1 predicted protein [Uncinocarpus reesii 1704]
MTASVLCRHREWIRLQEGKLTATSRLGHIVNDELQAASEQYPGLITLVGARAKNTCLKHLFPSSRRRYPTASINLGVESALSPNPLLFVDTSTSAKDISGVDHGLRSRNSCHAETPYVIRWASERDLFDIFQARLLFLFSDVVCLFADDFPSIQAVVQKITTWVEIGNASDFPSQVEEAREVRRSHRCLFSAQHILALFQKAIQHTAATITEPCNFIAAAMSTDREAYAYHLRTFSKLATKLSLPADTVAQHVSSCILVESYRPRMHHFSARAVFRSQYHHETLTVLEELHPGDLAERMCNTIEDHLEELLFRIERESRLAVACHQENLQSQCESWKLIKTNLTCLACLHRAPERVKACGHSICDICVRRFGRSSPASKNRYLLDSCVLCLARGALTVDMKPRTAGVRMLGIDGGGCRVVMAIQYLTELEKLLHGCFLHEVFDIVSGTSAGGPVLMLMFRHNRPASYCGKTVDKVARRCFGELKGRWRFLRALLRFLHLRAIYSETSLEDLLKVECGDGERLFGHAEISGVRIAVTAVSDRGTRSILTNYNGAVQIQDDRYSLVRPQDIAKEPLIWEV